jgi:hypothetical protein
MMFCLKSSLLLQEKITKYWLDMYVKEDQCAREIERLFMKRENTVKKILQKYVPPELYSMAIDDLESFRPTHSSKKSEK